MFQAKVHDTDQNQINSSRIACSSKQSDSQKEEQVMEELEEIQDHDNFNVNLRSGSGLTIPDYVANEKANGSNDDKNSKGKAPALEVIIDIEDTNNHKPDQVPGNTPQGCKKKTTTLPSLDGPKEKFLQ